MDISTISSVVSEVQRSSLADSVGLIMLSKVKDQTEEQGRQMVQMMERSVQPHLGGTIDIRL